MRKSFVFKLHGEWYESADECIDLDQPLRYILRLGHRFPSGKSPDVGVVKTSRFGTRYQRYVMYSFDFKDEIDSLSLHRSEEGGVKA